MKAISSCSGGVMFVPESVERETNKARNMPRSYREIAGEDTQAKPLRDRILGVFKINKKDTEAA